MLPFCDQFNHCVFDPLESVTVFSSTWPPLGDNVEYDAAGIEIVAGCDVVNIFR
jgi:hypothetical protein